MRSEQVTQHEQLLRRPDRPSEELPWGGIGAYRLEAARHPRGWRRVSAGVTAAAALAAPRPGGIRRRWAVCCPRLLPSRSVAPSPCTRKTLSRTAVGAHAES